jgi:DNA polymerase V
MKHTQRTTGFGSPAESYAENDIDWNALLLPKPHAMYIFKIRGSGNEEDKICDKDLAIVDCSTMPKSGDLIVFTVAGEFIIGRYTETEKDIVGVVSRIVRLLGS